MTRWRAVLAVLLVIGYAPAALPYSAMVEIEVLVAGSELIVLADVLAVVESGAGPQRQRVATARVVESWKGSADRAQIIKFIASRGWFMCDTSNARVGERVALFLSQKTGEAHPRIAHFGRGRMPVVTIDGASVAEIYEVTFPSSVPVRRSGTKPMRDGVDLGRLKAFIEAAVSRSVL